MPQGNEQNIPQTSAPVSSVPQAPQPPHSLKKELLIGLGGIVLLLCLVGYFLTSSSSSMQNKAPVIGIVAIPQVKEADEGFKERLAELGYNAVYDERVVVIGPTFEADAKKAVEELVAADVDLIFADFEAQAKMALDATSAVGRTDIPIIFISRLHDPITYGLIESFQSSGNNATGVATNLIELVQRHFEFLKQIAPDAQKLAMFGRGFQIPSVAAEYDAEVRRQAPNFGFELVEYTTDVPPPQAKTAFDEVVATIKKGDIDAMMHIAGHYYEVQEIGESELAIRLGIPMATNYEDIPRGGHFTYSNGTRESGEQAAVIADKILRGAAPSDIPVEYAQKGMLSLHLGRARAAGIEFPESMLYLAENKYETDDEFPAHGGH